LDEQGVRLDHQFQKGDKMKITKLLLTCMCCIIVVPAVWGQTPNVPTKPGILGYLDPQTGAFRPAPAASADALDPVTLTTFTGTITVTLTITVKSTGLTSFSCSAGVSVLDAITSSAPRGYDESATAAATGSGTTRTCKLTIPYAWGLATQSADSMTVTYGVLGSSTTVATRTSGLSPLATQKVPANGATTALTAAVTI
jgi:hypothetical protein